MDCGNLCKMTKANLEKKTCNKIILHRQNYVMEDPRPASPLSVMGTHSHNYIWIIEYLIETKFSRPPPTSHCLCDTLGSDIFYEYFLSRPEKFLMTKFDFQSFLIRSEILNYCGVSGSFSSYQCKVLVVKPKFVHNRVLSCHKFLDKSLPIPDETLTFIKYKQIKTKLIQTRILSQNISPNKIV